MGTEVRRVPDGGVLAHREGIRRVYARTFTAPPWAEDEQAADRFLERLAQDAERPGFTAALALDAGEPVGFATAWRTPETFPGGRCYPQVGAALGPRRTAQWLCGALEVDELALEPAARGGGLGAALLATVTEPAADGRCWLLTSARAGSALAFYRRLGWVQVTHPAPEGGGAAVFLGPRHPGRDGGVVGEV
ncbi:GNAT family N-acetyltransferase [Streptomyces sp. NPDC020141]|uniref:GNAT family N-acetyltransferase n=1 Tax=Streptomyces sp. NPDC020141 TaxID=3365065 RepID=UPI0037B2D694